jgi:hypothetical protein
MEKKEIRELTDPNQKDKNLLIEFVEGLEFNGVIPELENKEPNLFLDSIFTKLIDFKKDLLLTIEKI